MSDIIRLTIEGIQAKTTDHYNAVATLTNLIDDVFAGELTDEETKQVEAYVGEIVSHLEAGTISSDTAITSLEEARNFSQEGQPKLLELIAITGE